MRRLNRWKVWVNSGWMTRGEPSVCTKDLNFTFKVELISVIHLGREIRDVRARRDFSLDSKRKKKKFTTDWGEGIMDKPNNHEPEAGSNARHTHQTSTELGIFFWLVLLRVIKEQKLQKGKAGKRVEHVTRHETPPMRYVWR